MKVLVIHGSSRQNGNSNYLTNELLEGIPHTTLCLRDYDIQPIVDQRHEEGGFTTVDDDY